MFTSSVAESVIEEYAGADCPPDEIQARIYEKDPCLARQWIFFRIKMLDENTEEALDIFFDCIEHISFDDYKRLESLVAEYKNDMSSSIVPGGNDYVSSRSACTKTRSKLCDEIWNGISQLYTAQEMASMDMGELADKLLSMKKILLDSGIVVDITSTDEGVEKTIPLVRKHLSSFKCPVRPVWFPDEALLKSS